MNIHHPYPFFIFSRPSNLPVLSGILLFQIISISVADGADEQPQVEMKEKLHNTLETRIGDKNEDGNTPAILNDPEVKPAYETCKKQNNATSDAEYEKNMLACLTKEVGESKFPALYDKYMKLNDKTNNSYESLHTSDIDNSSDPAIKKLGDYYLGRLKEALYGDTNNGAPSEAQFADHGVFLEMFESQLGKNVVSTVTFYCIDANSENNYLIPKEAEARKKQRQKNLQSLKEKSKNGDKDGPPVAYENWSTCITKIQDICHRPEDYKNKKDGKPDLNYEYSQQRACIITSNLRALKQNLFAIDDIKKAQKKNAETAAGVEIIEKKPVTIYRGIATEGNEKSKSIDDLTTISSNEAINTSGYGSALEEQADDLKKNCVGDKINDEVCEKYINLTVDKKKLDKAKDEYIVESGGVQKKIQDTVTDESGVEKYLEDERKKDFDKLVTEENSKALKDRINENYEIERANIIKQLSENIKTTSVSESGDSLSSLDNQKTLEKIQKGLESASQEYKELVHFNNIISGYFEVIDSDNKKLGANTRSIAHEMRDSAFAKEKDSRDPANYDSDDFQELEKITSKITEKSTEEKADDSTRGNAALSPDQINDLMLNYDELQKKTGP